VANELVSLSHGRGRWFDPSIAHFENMPICRLSIDLQGQLGMFAGLSCSIGAATQSNLYNLKVHPHTLVA